jgi:Rod binding domain-containing protein
MSIETVRSSSFAQPSLSASKDSPAKIKQAATDFEALLLAQMMKSAREASGGGLTADGTDDSEVNSTVIELGEQQFAQALASSGGLGIAKMVVTGLAKNANR